MAKGPVVRRAERQARRLYEAAALTLAGEQVELQPMSVARVGAAYRSWMNSPQVTRYLEARFQRWSIPQLRRYVETVRADPLVWFFAICLRADGRMVGTTKLGPVNRAHSTAEVGIVVGEQSLHGRGIGTEAIDLVSRFGMQTLGLRKLTAGAYEPNQASVRAFLKAGWQVEATIPEQCLLDGHPVGKVVLGRYNEYWPVPPAKGAA